MLSSGAVTIKLAKLLLAAKLAVPWEACVKSPAVWFYCGKCHGAGSHANASRRKGARAVAGQNIADDRRGHGNACKNTRIDRDQHVRCGQRHRYGRGLADYNGGGEIVTVREVASGTTLSIPLTKLIA